MPQHTKAQQLQRIQRIKALNAYGYKPSEIYQQIKDDIDVNYNQVCEDVRQINKGAYNDPWLDSFLEVQYPEFYRLLISSFNEALKTLRESLNSDTEKTRIAAAKNLGLVSSEFLNAMHKGPALREMRRVAEKAKKLSKELMEERKINKKQEEFGGFDFTQYQEQIKELGDETVSVIEKQENNS